MNIFLRYCVIVLIFLQSTVISYAYGSGTGQFTITGDDGSNTVTIHAQIHRMYSTYTRYRISFSMPGTGGYWEPYGTSVTLESPQGTYETNESSTVHFGNPGQYSWINVNHNTTNQDLTLVIENYNNLSFSFIWNGLLKSSGFTINGNIATIPFPILLPSFSGSDDPSANENWSESEPELEIPSHDWETTLTNDTSSIQDYTVKVYDQETDILISTLEPFRLSPNDSMTLTHQSSVPVYFKGTINYVGDVNDWQIEFVDLGNSTPAEPVLNPSPIEEPYTVYDFSQTDFDPSGAGGNSGSDPTGQNRGIEQLQSESNEQSALANKTLTGIQSSLEGLGGNIDSLSDGITDINTTLQSQISDRLSRGQNTVTNVDDAKSEVLTGLENLKNSSPVAYVYEPSYQSSVGSSSLDLSFQMAGMTVNLHPANVPILDTACVWLRRAILFGIGIFLAHMVFNGISDLVSKLAIVPQVGGQSEISGGIVVAEASTKSLSALINAVIIIGALVAVPIALYVLSDALGFDIGWLEFDFVGMAPSSLSAAMSIIDYFFPINSFIASLLFTVAFQASLPPAYLLSAFIIKLAIF